MGREMKGHYRGHLAISVKGTLWVGCPGSVPINSSVTHNMFI